MYQADFHPGWAAVAQWVEQMASERRFPARAVSRCPWARYLAPPPPPEGNGTLPFKRVALPLVAGGILDGRWLQGVIVAKPFSPQWKVEEK